LRHCVAENASTVKLLPHWSHGLTASSPSVGVGGSGGTGSLGGADMLIVVLV
jgi:hypothetical protein